MKFDPMTGEPIQETEQPTGQPEMNFDPMTGQPIQQNQGGQGNMGMKKSGKWIVAAGVAAGVVVVGAVVCVGMTSGAFLSDGNKVLLATANTFGEESHLTGDLSNIVDIIGTGKYTLGVTADVEGVEIDGEFIDASSKKQLKGTVDTGYLEVEVDAVLDSKQFAVKMPTVDDQVYVYKYTEENDGYLIDSLDEDVVDSFNELLTTVNSSKEQDQLTEALKDAVLEEYKELKFKKVDKEEYEIDGKDRKCKGYETTITSDNMLDILDEVEEILEDEYDEALESVDIDLNDMFSDLRYSFRNMPDIDVTFYIYKNKLACINVEVDGDDAELLFLGGETRTQNMKLKVEGDTILEVKGSTEDGVERTRLYVQDEEVCDVKYDYKEGKFTVDAPDLYVNASIDASKNNVAITLKDLEVDDRIIGIEGTISVKKGAKVTALKGEEFDLGNASESDFEELLENIQDAAIGW